MKQFGGIKAKIPGFTVVEGLELLSEDEKTALKSVEDSLTELDWSGIIHKN